MPKQDGDSLNPNLVEVGTDLSERLAAIEKRLGSLQRKCKFHKRFEGTLSEFAPSSIRKPGQAFTECKGLGFKREGGVWQLYFVEEGWYMPPQRKLRDAYSMIMGEETPIPITFEEWTRLGDVSLELKAKAASWLAEFLDEMEHEYQRRTMLVRDAHEVLNRFERRLNMSELEGE